MQAVAFHFDSSGAEARQFRQFWTSASRLCDMVPEVQALGKSMRRQKFDDNSRSMHAAASAALRTVGLCDEAAPAAWKRTARGKATSAYTRARPAART